MSHLKLIFVLLKLTRLVSLFDHKLYVFIKKVAKLAIFWHLYVLLSTLARLFNNFPTLCFSLIAK